MFSNILEPSCFENQVNLETLDLERNALRHVQSDWFTGLVRLNTLILRANEIQTIPRDAFEPLKQLKFLDLSSNGLICPHREMLLTLPNLNRVALTMSRTSTHHGLVFKPHAFPSMPDLSVVLQNCEENTKQWIRLEMVVVVLSLYYDAGSKRFDIEWVSTLSNENYVPTKSNPECKQLPEQERTGHFTANSPFVVIATNDVSSESFSTQCSETWSSAGGMNLVLNGPAGQELRLYILDPRSEFAQPSSQWAFALVVKKSTVDSETAAKNSDGGTEQPEMLTVPCFVIIRGRKKHDFFFNTSSRRRRNRNKNPVIRQPDFPLSALQRNPMYGGGLTETPQAQNVQCPTQTKEVIARTDDNVYNQINEESVYDSSEHSYCEITDDNTRDETSPVVDSICQLTVEEDTINNVNVPEQGFQNDNNEGDSLSFYAASAEVDLPTTENIVDKTLLYNVAT
ncbi:regulation of response to stimulus [Branchiostoma belcheri]|nr:regulation of response to stimulus [Branchiostoma belcheri]